MNSTAADFASDRALRREAGGLKSWRLTPRQTADLELLGNGGFSPLSGFLDEADYRAVVGGMRLASGALWPMPILLDLPEAFAGGLALGSRLALLDEESRPRALMTVQELFRREPIAEAEAVFGSARPDHPGVARLPSAKGPGPQAASSTSCRRPPIARSRSSSRRRRSSRPSSPAAAGRASSASRPATRSTAPTMP